MELKIIIAYNVIISLGLVFGFAKTIAQGRIKTALFFLIVGGLYFTTIGIMIYQKATL